QPEAHAAAIAREADGHPLFIDVLVQHDTGEREAQVLRLEEALRSRVQRLDEPTRHVIQLVAVAGRPIAREVLAHAAEARSEALTKQLAFLRTAHLVVTSGAGTKVRVDLFHDRVRATVVSDLADDDRTRLHRALATALEDAGDEDAEMLAAQWQGARDR